MEAVKTCLDSPFGKTLPEGVWTLDQGLDQWFRMVSKKRQLLLPPSVLPYALALSEQPLRTGGVAGGVAAGMGPGEDEE